MVPHNVGTSPRFASILLILSDFWIYNAFGNVIDIYLVKCCSFSFLICVLSAFDRYEWVYTRLSAYNENEYVESSNKNTIYTSSMRYIYIYNIYTKAFWNYANWCFNKLLGTLFVSAVVVIIMINKMLGPTNTRETQTNSN